MSDFLKNLFDEETNVTFLSESDLWIEWFEEKTGGYPATNGILEEDEIVKVTINRRYSLYLGFLSLYRNTESGAKTVRQVYKTKIKSIDDDQLTSDLKREFLLRGFNQ
jgi:hypothetical protein